MIRQLTTMGLISAVALMLASCAATNGKFDCNKVGGRGVGCASLGTVNQMANEGAFNQTDTVNNGDVNAYTATPASVQSTGFTGVTPSAGMPLRYGESVQNVWIAPFVDTGGSYHWPQMVSVIVTPGHWVGRPVAAIQDSMEG